MNRGQTEFDRLLADKREELEGMRGQRAAAMSDRELAELGRRLPRPRDFAAALADGPGPAMIAEFRRVCPRDGELREGADPRVMATAFAAGGARAVGVATDRGRGGSHDDLRAVRQAVTLPLLARDLVLERWQVLEAKRTGADAIAVVAAALPPPRLRQVIAFAHHLELQVVCEAHDEHEVDRAMAAGARTVCVDARDPESGELDLARAQRLRGLVPRSFALVIEGGITSIVDARRLAELEPDALLLSSYLMRADDPEDTLSALCSALY